jgi:hypothetical protein
LIRHHNEFELDQTPRLLLCQPKRSALPTRSPLMENAEKSKYTIKAKRNGIEQQFEIKIPKKLKTANL